MKFMAKTEMYTATFRDLNLATMQGTLNNSPLTSYTNSMERRMIYYRGALGTCFTYLFFGLSMTVLVYGIFVLRKVKREEKSVPTWSTENGKEEPLVFA
jgi:hypothetical protein